MWKESILILLWKGREYFNFQEKRKGLNMIMWFMFNKKNVNKNKKLH